MKSGIRTGFALTWVVALFLVAAAFFGLNGWLERPVNIVPTKDVAETEQLPADVATPGSVSIPAQVVPVIPAPAKIVSEGPVSTLDLDQLAAAVNLRESTMGASKQAWATELPVAKKLLQRPCDCDQRNWLNHYVKTANDALSGSEDYAHSIQLLATLRRSDQDLTLSSSPSR